MDLAAVAVVHAVDAGGVVSAAAAVAAGVVLAVSQGVEALLGLGLGSEAEDEEEGDDVELHIGGFGGSIGWVRG